MRTGMKATVAEKEPMARSSLSGQSTLKLLRTKLCMLQAKSTTKSAAQMLQGEGGGQGRRRGGQAGEGTK